MANLACSSNQALLQDELYARRLQSEELPHSFSGSYTSLAHRLEKYKLDSMLKKNSKPTRQDNQDDSVIIIDDDDDVEVTTNSEPSLSTFQTNLNRNKREIEELIRADEEFARKLQADLDKEYTNGIARQTTRNAAGTSSLSPTSSAFENSSTGSGRRRLNDHSDSLQSAYRILNRSTDQLNRAANVRSENFYGMHPSIEQDMFNLMARNISSNELSSTSRDPTTTMPVRLSQMSNRRRHHLPDQQEHRNRFEPATNHTHNIFQGANEASRAARQHALNFQNLSFIRQQNQRLFRQNLLFDNEQNSYERLLRLDERNVKMTVSKQEFESLGKFHFKKTTDDSDMNQCSICFEDYEPKSTLTALVCSHKFHSSCIKKWLNQSRRCPLCQKDAINGT